MNLLHQPFAAHAYLPDWGNELVSGQIMVTGLALRFESPQAALEIPHSRLIAEVRANDPDRITFTDAERPGLEIFTADLELLDCNVTPALIRAREELESRLSRRELKRRVRLLGYCVMFCILATVVATAGMSFMVRSIANRVPPEWDAKFGAALMQGIGEEAEVLDDANATARLSTLAEPLLRVLPQTTNGYRLHIIKDAEPNAFALPGGHIVIHTGLMDLVEQPEELLGVLAHEVAHVTERHIYRKQISTAGPLLICGLFVGRGSGVVDVLGGGAALLVGAGFSQEYETEADETGWNYLVAANIDPRGMIRVFEKLKAYEEKEARLDVTPDAFSSHPALDKRMKRLENRWRKLPRKDGFVEFPKGSMAIVR